MENLDQLAAKAAQGIIDQTKKSSKATDVENLVTKALGVLQENGAYAALLYLFSRGNSIERPIAEQTRKSLLDLLSKLSLSVPEKKEAAVALKFMVDSVCYDLDKLLLVKQLWEQTLIYARYGAKAWDAENKAQEEKKKREEAGSKV
jgi:hypothetical protein